MLKHRWVLRVALLMADFVLLELVFFFTYWWRFRTGLFTNPIDFTALEFLVPSILISTYWNFVFAWFGLYRFDPLMSRAHVVQHSLKAAGLGVLILFILTFDPNQPLSSTRIILAAYGVAVCVIVAGNRVALLTLLKELRLRGVGLWRTLLVGNGVRAASVLRYLFQHPELGAKITGILRRSDDTTLLQNVKLVGTFSRLRSVLKTGNFDAVIFALDEGEERLLGRMVRASRGARVRSLIQADQYQILLGEVKPTHLHGHPLVEIKAELLSPAENLMKRATDLVIASVFLIVTLPLWALFAVLIVLDSPGSVFYLQKRVGKNGQEFTLIKFRSMVQNAEEHTGAVMTAAKDPRITRVGRIMRASRLDELPQLINVLHGDMSLVGPRPERSEFVREFAKQIPLYERRLNVKPGLTGWSQVHLKYDASTDHVSVKLKYDFYYIENMTLPLDIKIILMTLFVALRGEGAIATT